MTNCTNYLIKGDVSGIQEFIFSTTSKGAARTLKDRSWYVQMLCTVCGEKIIGIFGEENVNCLYNGGGNFYYIVSSVSDIGVEIQKIKEQIDNDLRHDEVYLALSYVKISSFGQAWQQIKKEAAKSKLRRFSGAEGNFFAPWQYKKEIHEISHENLRRSEYLKEYLGENVGELYQKEEKQLKENLPQWNEQLLARYSGLIKEEQETGEDSLKAGEVINFNYLAQFAKERTGTDRLGILKMDIDNLSNYFNRFDTQEKATELSGLLSGFFEKELYDFIASGTFTHANQEYHFKDSIYTVFAGGDDCFFVGAYDAIFEFALQLHEKFEKFSEGKDIQRLTNGKELTISAGIVLVDSHYPIVRFAEMADEQLDKAKDYLVNGETVKNAITVFGEVLSWDDFKTSATKKKILFELIAEKQESRALLEKIKGVASGFENLQEKLRKNTLQLPRVWHLSYFIKNIKKNNRDTVEKEIFNPYQQSLIKTYGRKNEGENPMIYPITARWTELLTRKKAQS